MPNTAAAAIQGQCSSAKYKTRPDAASSLSSSASSPSSVRSSTLTLSSSTSSSCTTIGRNSSRPTVKRQRRSFNTPSAISVSSRTTTPLSTILLDASMSRGVLCMMLTSMVLFWTTSLSRVSAQYCNICPQNAVAGLDTSLPVRGSSHLLNPTQIVLNFVTESTTCADLQFSVGDVLSSPEYGASDIEAEHCAKNQFLACVSGCCHPPNSPSLGDGSCYNAKVHDPNPACDLCGGPVARQYDYVPGPNIEKLTDTKYVGVHNCQGLYRAAAEGVFTSNFCPVIQTESGGDCCDLSDTNVVVVNGVLDTSNEIQYNASP